MDPSRSPAREPNKGSVPYRRLAVALSLTLLGPAPPSVAQPIDCERLPAGITECVRDEDCAYSPRIGLCDCANGGTEIAVNGSRLFELYVWGAACTGGPCLFFYNCNGYQGTRCVEGTCILGSCGDSLVAPGEICDTGSASPTCDSDCTDHGCGDWTVNGAIGETCDDGNSADGDGCSAACVCDDSSDADADGVGDACDSCVNDTDDDASSVLTLRSIGLDPVADDDGVKLRTSFRLGSGVPFEDLDLALDDLRLSLRRATSGTPVMELVVPAGAFDGVRGWKTNTAHTAWSYVDKGTTPLATGIRKARLLDASSMGLGMVLLKLSGRDGDYPVNVTDVPLHSTVAIGDGAGRCGEQVYDRIDCRVSGLGDKIKCHR